MNKTKFFYFSSLSYNAVFETQVLNWINLYRENNLNWSIVIINSIKNIRKFKKLLIERQTIRKHNKIGLTYLFTWPDRFFLGFLLNVFTISVFFLPALIKYQKVVIQIRSASYFKTFAFYKKLFPNRFKVVFDLRAAYAEEFAYNNPDYQKDPVKRKKYLRLLNEEKDMVDVSSLVFCVSNHLANYHIDKLKNPVDRDKFFVNPCNADSRLFYFSSQERENIRNDLDLNNKFIIAYSGGLEMPWHMSKQIFSFFSRILKLIPDSYFFILTSEPDIANKLANDYNLNPEIRSILSIENDEVRKYLNASDLSLLLREKAIMNQVASPTKFAEYLMCGLPVVISPNVGDFSELITKKNWGFVYEAHFSDEILLTKIKKFINNSTNGARELIARDGALLYSKQSNLYKILEQYQSL